MLTRLLRLRAVNRVLPFKSLPVLKVFNNQAVETHCVVGRDGCVRSVAFKVLRIGMAIGAASVFTKVGKHTIGSRCGVA